MIVANNCSPTFLLSLTHNPQIQSSFSTGRVNRGVSSHLVFARRMANRMQSDYIPLHPLGMVMIRQAIPAPSVCGVLPIGARS